MKEKHEPSEKKKQVVSEFRRLIEEYPIVGTLDMENLPTKQLQNMRAQLRDTVVIKMTKRRLIRIALEEEKEKKPGIEKLEENLKGMPALLFTKENPFSLYAKLKKNKSTAPAKAGQKAPKDIIVPAGPTPFAPGPIIGELGKFRIKTGIEDGKVAVKEDTVVVKEGEEISAELAGILARLGIEPMEIGLDLVCVYEDGSIFKRDILDIDVDDYYAKVQAAAAEVFNLAIFASIPTKDTIETLIGKANMESVCVGLSQGIMAPELMPQLIAKVESEGQGLKAKIGL
jgi:large subunit ribosomal protein L10